MTIVESIIIGVIQGLTEFLPVSSDGHIELGKIILGLQDIGLDFTILVHVATALSSVIIFRKDIAGIIAGLFRFSGNSSWKLIFMLAVSAIPVAIVGLLFMEEIESLFTGNLVYVGIGLLGTALMLYLTTVAGTTDGPVTFPKAFLMGIAQMFAVFPGLSRSGSTISTALLLNINREEATRFSFLMVLVPIFGQALLDGIKISKDPSLWKLPIDVSIAGFAASFIVGLFACTAMIRIVKKGKLHYFSIYCVVIGVIALIVGLS